MPDGPPLIIVLFVLGFALIAAEVFLPGVILGLLGLLCLAGSVALVFVHYGNGAGMVAAFLIGGLTLGGFIVWLWIFPRTFIGRRIVLGRTQPPDHTAEENRGLVGSTGVALTPLRPAGTARIDGRRTDVTATGEFLEAGAGVVVVAADGMRVVVRRKDGLEPGAETA